MRTSIAWVLAACLACACGNGSGTTEESSQTDTTGEEDTPANGTESLPPATTADGILQRLARAATLEPSTWDPETSALVEPGRVEPLVGTARAAIVAHLGEPNAADFAQEGQAGWSIGRLETERMGHPPILVLTFDASGVVTAARFQLSM